METVWKETFKETISAQASQTFVFAPQSQGVLFVRLENQASYDLNIVCQQDSQVTVFIHNCKEAATHLHVQVEMYKDATCKMGVLDMENAPLDWKHFVDLKESGANYEILSGQFCMAHQDKICDMEVRHSASHTYGEIKNFAVIMDHGHYEMVANGNITKGCFDAHSHQATRVLTLGKDHYTKCIPLLLIDENDVKASHALTVGQPDEEQMYYLQSRGLTKEQAIGLLSVGYLLPVIQMVDDEKAQEQLQVEMESKVGLYGCK